MKKICSILFLLILVGCSGIDKRDNRVEEREGPEFRGVWIASVVNINWPKTVGTGKNAERSQKKEFIKLLDQAVEMNMNAVVVQIRPTADTFYPSSFEPWSKYLTGTQGTSPGWDPLQFMVEESHRRGLQFHAWFNPYRVTMKKEDVPMSNHPAVLNPEWTFRYGGKLYYNPGIPEAMNYSIDNIMEVVKNYDIDGVHMDDYFYPYPVKGEKLPDWKTYLKYGKYFPIAADWRRDNVDKFIKTLNSRIKKEKPNVQFGISPFGVWRNYDVDKSGSKTRAGITNYDTLYADTRKWIDRGWIDYIVPQIYWNQGFKAAEYNTLVNWWADEVRGTDVKLYIGQAAYKVGTKGWKDPYELINQVRYNRGVEGVGGSIYFSIDSLIDNPVEIKENMKKTVYKERVKIPN
ncbi:glycoside hydrolase family 10 protein, partial [Psychrilyobacter atlanticus]|uniref:glycoside hydrolase family 10 protein n=1 Tax=Psychrilyobacter atlanticus TaxID=271091 RepID=UPI00041891C3